MDGGTASNAYAMVAEDRCKTYLHIAAGVLLQRDSFLFRASPGIARRINRCNKVGFHRERFPHNFAGE